MRLQLLYFARLRERFGCAGETLDVTAEIRTIADVLAVLRARGGVWQEELAGERVFRVALNQQLVGIDATVHDNAELAIFPPVTGG